MLDNPHEGFEGGGIGIGEADAEQVEMDRAGNMAVRVGVGRPEVEEQQRRSSAAADQASQFSGRNQQLRIRVTLHPAEWYNSRPSTPNSARSEASGPFRSP